MQEIPMPSQINGYEYELLACKKALSEERLFCPKMPHEEKILMLEWMDHLRNAFGIRYPFE